MDTMDVDFSKTLSLTDLPLELLCMIARYVKREDKVWLASTCRLFRYVFYSSKHLLEPNGTLYNKYMSFVNSESRMAFILTQTKKRVDDEVLRHAMSNAAERSDIKTMALILDKCHNNVAIRVSSGPAGIAARRGDVDMLRWLRVHKFHMTDLVAVTAARNRHLHVLDYLLSIGRVDVGVVVVAAREGLMDVLRWCKRNDVDDSRYGLNVAALFGHARVFRWLLAHGRTVDDETMTYSAHGGNMDIIKLTFKLRPIVPRKVCEVAAEQGHTKVIEWALSLFCPWDEQRCQDAAIAGGRLDTLIYILSVATVVRPDICAHAHAAWQWRILEWLLDNGYCDDGQYAMYRGSIAAQNT